MVTCLLDSQFLEWDDSEVYALSGFKSWWFDGEAAVFVHKILGISVETMYLYQVSHL